MQVRVRRRGRPSVALITAAAVAALAASCGSTASHSRHGTATGPAVFTEPSNSPWRPCSEAVTNGVVRSVVRAFNAGDTATLDRLIAQPPRFRWFSAPGPQARFNTNAFRRSTLPEYVRGRHRHKERLTIVRLAGLVVARHADDYPRRVVDVKRTVDCTPGKPPALIVWSVGSDPATL